MSTSVNNPKVSRNPRRKLAPLLGLVGLILLSFLSSCATTEPTSRTADFGARYSAHGYVELDAVKQTTANSCGVAALTCVLNYWEIPVTESGLLKKYPPAGKVGYPITQLRTIAKAEGALAFALADKDAPIVSLLGHVNKGRPIIAAVLLPHGRYFGRKIPVIETLDRRTIWNTGLGDGEKLHYVVVFGASESKRTLLLMDPAYGIVELDQSQFENFWRHTKYAALLCAKGG